MENYIQRKSRKTAEGEPIALLVYGVDECWYFMGEETQDLALVFACMMAAPLFSGWGNIPGKC